MGFPDGLGVKNLSANAGAAGDTGSIPESGRFPREGNGNQLQLINARIIPWTKELVGLEAMGLQRVRHH